VGTNPSISPQSKWIAPFYSARGIGLSTIRSDVLIVIGAYRREIKINEIPEVGNKSIDISAISHDIAKWMPQMDSRIEWVYRLSVTAL
jgi:hypothetical protein